MPEAPASATVTTGPSAAAGADRRIPGLDGLRGIAGLSVVVSHYFGEVAHGIQPLMVGWIAVDIFFVLSGFLIGRLILDKKKHRNFFAVFYARRFWRLLPAYFVTLGAVALLIAVLPAAWADAGTQFPLASYFLFLQGFWMVATDTIGAHWLAPTWTLAVEEHFYLLVPALIVFSPRRVLVPSLVAAGIVALILRALAVSGGPAMGMATLVLLPGRADLLSLGVLAALLDGAVPALWSRWMPLLRIAPLAGLLAAIACRLTSEALFTVLGPTFVGIGCAALILGIVRGTPEGDRFDAPPLRFIGDNTYCLYLTHLPVLGLMHGLILGQRPDLATPAQWAVTLAALPVCMVFARGMTRLVEEPFMAYARRWRWGAERSTPPQFILAASPGL